MRRLLTATIALLCSMFMAAAAGVTYSNIQYREGDAYALERCKLDVYVPEGALQAPVVVFFHGGGLTGGNKYMPLQLMDSGIIVVSANYRLLPGATIDQCISDAAAAVAWTFKNIAHYGGKTDRICVSGHSAGGYLTDMIVLEKKWLAAFGIDSDEIWLAAPMSGQVITHFAIRQQRGMSEVQPLIDEYAPLFHVRGDAPEFLIVSADREMELYGRYEETAYFARALKLNGHKKVTFRELDGFNHGNMIEPGLLLLRNWIVEAVRK